MHAIFIAAKSIKGSGCINIKLSMPSLMVYSIIPFFSELSLLFDVDRRIFISCVFSITCLFVINSGIISSALSIMPNMNPVPRDVLWFESDSMSIVVVFSSFLFFVGLFTIVFSMVRIDFWG